MQTKNNVNMRFLFIFPQGIGDFLHALDKLILSLIFQNNNCHTFILQYYQQKEILNYLYPNKKKIFLTSNIKKNIFLIFNLFFHLLLNRFDFIVIDPNINKKKIFIFKFFFRKKIILINKKFNEHFTKIDAYESIHKYISGENINKFSLLDALPKKNFNKQSSNIGISVGSGSLEKHKRWPINYFSDLINLILSNYPSIKINLYGSTNEEYLNNHLIQSLDKKYAERIELIKDPNIYNIFSLFSNLKLFISNDNGLSHFSTLLNIKTYVIYGPTLTYSNGYNKNRLPLKLNYKCSPCYDNYRFGCGDPKCMKNLYPEIIFNLINKDISKIAGN